jgi:hypothetical protein
LWHHSQIVGWDGGGLTNCLPRLASNHPHLYLHLPRSWDYKCVPGPYSNLHFPIHNISMVILWLISALVEGMTLDNTILFIKKKKKVGRFWPVIWSWLTSMLSERSHMQKNTSYMISCMRCSEKMILETDTQWVLTVRFDRERYTVDFWGVMKMLDLNLHFADSYIINLLKILQFKFKIG